MGFCRQKYESKKKLRVFWDIDTFAHKVLGANIATERPCATTALIVRALVEQQIALQRERLAAFATAIRSFAATVWPKNSRNCLNWQWRLRLGKTFKCLIMDVSHITWAVLESKRWLRIIFVLTNRTNEAYITFKTILYALSLPMYTLYMGKYQPHMRN